LKWTNNSLFHVDGIVRNYFCWLPTIVDIRLDESHLRIVNADVLEHRKRKVVEGVHHVQQVLLQLGGLPDVKVLRLLKNLLFIDGWIEVQGNEGLALGTVAVDILMHDAEKLEGAEEHQNHSKHGFVGWLTELLVLLEGA